MRATLAAFADEKQKAEAKANKEAAAKLKGGKASGSGGRA